MKNWEQIAVRPAPPTGDIRRFLIALDTKVKKGVSNLSNQEVQPANTRVNGPEVITDARLLR